MQQPPPRPGPGLAELILRDLRALRRRYRAADRLLDVRTVDRCIAIARLHIVKADPPESPGPGDRDHGRQGSAGETDSWLLERFTRST